MRVMVRLFAVAKERAGRPTIELELPEGATVADLKSALALDIPDLARFLPSIRIAIDSEYADEATPIPPFSQVAVIPPVSGGAVDLPISNV